MSSSENVGSLALANGRRFYFAQATTPEGGIPDEPIQVEEELRDRGIDFVRYLDDSLQFPEFTMNTVEDYQSDSAGVQLRRSYTAATAKYATLAIVRGGTTYTYKRVKVLGVIPQMRPGTLVGYGATANNVGTIVATWRLRLTERP
jgi:hypothetical protein